LYVDDKIHDKKDERFIVCWWYDLLYDERKMKERWKKDERKMKDLLCVDDATKLRF
jgi:hypothetical protein